MSAETLIDTTELTPQPNGLPTGEALRQSYKLEFTTLDLPSKYRVTDDFFESNVVYDGPEPDIQTIRDRFVSQAAETAYADSWWVQAAARLIDKGADPALVDNLSVTAKYDVDVLADGEPTGQGFEVFEIGERETDEDAVKTVFDTLRLVDQYSGGLLAADPERPVIALANNIRLGSNKNGGEVGGVAFGGGIVINMSALKDMAAEADADFHELLAIVVTHEILGHSLEKLSTKDRRSGQHFGRHFDYSQKRVPGEIFDDIHAAIEPKDSARHGSQPVREYGKVNSSEDFATSVDATVADAMGWSATADKIPRFKSEVDRHRRDLAIELMQRAASRALKHEHTPGFVGSNLRYRSDNENQATGVEQVREFEITPHYDNQIAQREIEAMIAKYHPGNEFIVSRGDLV